MRLTGLKDKNGNKIHEGDILRIKCLGWEYVVVKFHCGGFGFYVNEDSRLVYHVPQYWENSEIIGNIHDNPELAIVKEYSVAYENHLLKLKQLEKALSCLKSNNCDCLGSISKYARHGSVSV